VSDELIEVLATGRRVVPYVDVPLQHASDPVLRAMKRGTDGAAQRRLVERLRAAIPELTLRTSLIVGFPGETGADFQALCDFVRETRFDHLGVFRYSDEEGTAAFELPGKVPRELARERHEDLVAIQSRLMRERLEARVGEEATVLVDRAGGNTAAARLASQAPEIDGGVLVRSPLPPGTFARVRLVGARGPDLEAVQAT
jgi:ribosomal protein S12 methylthiotransferase